MTSLDTAAHYDEETLIRVAESETEIEDPHLTECDECRTAVDQYRDMLFCLEDESAWDHRPIDDTPNPQTIATLRSFVEEMHREDAEAEPLVAELLAGPREEWMPRLMGDAKYRTAGVVRKLIAATDRAAEQSPADYATLGDLSVEIVSSLDERRNGSAVTRLRASAHREVGYSRYLVGDLDAAHASVRRARELLSEAPSADFDAARLDILDATVESRRQRTFEALRLVERASSAFDHFGQRKRVADALWLKANVLAEQRCFRDALSVMRAMRRQFDDVIDEQVRAGLFLNEGYYLREIGDFVGAVDALSTAGFIFEELQTPVAIARVKFNLAVTLHAAGQSDAAGERLSESIEEFSSMGMTSAATLAALHLAEIRLQQERYAEIEPLCQRVFEQLTASEVAYRERALIAVSLLREASESRRISTVLIRNVRDYVARLPKEPNLLFALPLPPTEDRISG